MSIFNMILTTHCYLRNNNQTLLLFRNKKKEDINKGKWIGVGGKMEAGETPDQCIRREIEEETHLKAHSLKYHGFVVFVGICNGEDEGMFVYSCDDFEGTLCDDCKEGQLAWIDNDKIPSLPMWEADYHFFEWLNDHYIHHARVVYDENSHLLSYSEDIYK